VKKKNLSKTKFNIAWASVVVIFIGTMVYIPALKFAEQKSETVYYKVPVVEVRNQFPGKTTTTVNVQESEMENISENKNSEVEKEYSQEQNFLITKNLKTGDNDPEVKILQQYLNSQGFLVAESGAGSPGFETTLFGAGTREALIKFQEANKDILLTPVGLEKGTGVVGELTRKFINS